MPAITSSAKNTNFSSSSAGKFLPALQVGIADEQTDLDYFNDFDRYLNGLEVTIADDIIGYYASAAD